MIKEPTAEQIASLSSDRPWTYHNNGERDWIEDANGNIVLNNVGYLDGPLIVACVNEATMCGTDVEAVEEQRERRFADAE